MVNELGGADILQFVPATLRSVECRPASFYIDTPGFSVPSRPDHSLHRHDCRSTVSTCARAVCYSSPPCCTGRRCWRIEPYPCCGLCGADVLRAPEVQHPVQNVAGDGYLGRLSPIRLRAQPATNDAFPARDIGFHESAPVIP